MARSAFLTPASLFNCDKICGLLWPPTALTAKAPWCWVKNFRPGANSGVMPLCLSNAPPMPTAMLSPTMAILGPVPGVTGARGATEVGSGLSLLTVSGGASFSGMASFSGVTSFSEGASSGAVRESASAGKERVCPARIKLGLASALLFATAMATRCTSASLGVWPCSCKTLRVMPIRVSPACTRTGRPVCGLVGCAWARAS